MRAPKGPNVRIACCAFKNQRVSAVILETRNSTSGAIWFSTYRLLRNLLSLIRTNDDRSTRQVTSQPYSIHSISPTFRTCLKRPLQNKKFTWQCELNPNNQFFYLTKRKKYLCSEQLKQPFYSVIHSKIIETCYEDTTQTTIFWILAETFYIPSTFYNFNNQFIGWKWKF